MPTHLHIIGVHARAYATVVVPMLVMVSHRNVARGLTRWVAYARLQRHWVGFCVIDRGSKSGTSARARADTSNAPLHQRVYVLYE